LAIGISKLELALGIRIYQNDISVSGIKRTFSKKVSGSFRVNGRFVRASDGHQKLKGKMKRSRLQSLYFMTLVAGIGKCSGFLSPDVGWNAYAESGIQERWLLKETGLEYWRIVYPLVIVPNKTIPSLWKLYRKGLERQTKKN
jgi:hypothetical protein